jgi:lysozyme
MKIMKTSERGIRLLCEFEGFRVQAYIPVPGDVPTIGYGFTRGVKMGDTMTRAEAAARLRRELLEYERAVQLACTHQPNQNQFDALVCLAFNIGTAGLQKSSVLKAHNRLDYQAAARAFGLWNKSGGKVYAGLTRRRAAESALYLEPVESQDEEPEALPMPQKIDEEKPMTASTINRAGVVAGGSTAIVAVTETVNSINYLKRGVDELQDWLVPVLLIVSVCAVGYIIYERVKQRREGWV